jgi:hypothetical protein
VVARPCRSSRAATMLGPIPPQYLPRILLLLGPITASA